MDSFLCEDDEASLVVTAIRVLLVQISSEEYAKVFADVTLRLRRVRGRPQ